MTYRKGINQRDCFLIQMSRNEWDRERLRVRRNNPTLSWGDIPYSVAPYVPSPKKVVKKMLKLADAGSEDTVYDLGCGDGRILFAAIEEFGVKGAVGFELNASLCKKLQLNVEAKGLTDRIKVVNANFFTADLSQASVITMYLTTSGNSKLRPKLEEELGVGTRVVSHDFPIHNWVTAKPNEPYHYTLGSHKIYLYNIPKAFKKQIEIHRSNDEESRWKRLRDLFLRES